MLCLGIPLLALDPLFPFCLLDLPHIFTMAPSLAPLPMA